MMNLGLFVLWLYLGCSARLRGERVAKLRFFICWIFAVMVLNELVSIYVPKQ